MKHTKQLLSFLTALFLTLSLLPASALAAKSKDIVILYENDVHCAVEGYTKLAALKEDLSRTHDHVGAVSAGDFIQGSSLGTVSQGEYIVNLMNLVGYDAVTLGNHEFDYRLPRLLELTAQMNTKPVCSNFRDLRTGEPVFAPYTMVSYGSVDVAFIGITTPETLTSSMPGQFRDENGGYLYSFSGNALCETVQESIDAAEAAGAEYIIALSHLGTEYVPDAWCAQTLVQNTTGLDVVLDGHSHSVVEQLLIPDAGGREVLVTSTGTKFANIGKLTLSDAGITTELIPTEGLTAEDAAVTEYIEEINTSYQALGQRKIGVSEVALTTVDENGTRIIRSSETNLGDFCADAFRQVTGADIGFMNGGGIRTDIAAGDVTFNDLLSVFPFNNTVCVAAVTGQQIVDMLELGVRNYPQEDGTFQHVSGLTFDLNISIPSSVTVDENGAFIGVDGPDRVENVRVLNGETGTYEPIDPEKTYTLASHNYLLLELGGGATMFRDAEIVTNDGMLDVELLEIYLTEHLDGVVGQEYASSQNRIRSVEQPAAAEDAEHTLYTVRRGDTLWALSRKHGCTVQDIVALNTPPIKNPDLIYIGWQLKLPVR